MSAKIDYPQLYQSLTAYLGIKTAEFTALKRNDGKLKTVTKLTASTAIYATLTVGGLIESLVRSHLAVLVKIGQFFVPKQYTKKLDDKVVLPLVKHAKTTIEYTAKIATFMFIQFMSKETRIKGRKAIEKSIDKVFESKFLNNVLNLHINGFYVAPKIQTKIETPKIEVPKVVEQPKVETSKVEKPKEESKVVEQLQVETTKVETPKEEPKIEVLGNPQDIIFEEIEENTEVAPPQDPVVKQLYNYFTSFFTKAS